MITGTQIVLHLVGDYILQSDWMANYKTHRGPDGWFASLIHSFFYTAPFYLITQDWYALLVIMVTHFIIDHWRLARYVGWAKNLIAPYKPHPWSECFRTGYSEKHKPAWMAVWLMIITDNTMHLICNGLAIYYLGDM